MISNIPGFLVVKGSRSNAAPFSFSRDALAGQPVARLIPMLSLPDDPPERVFNLDFGALTNLDLGLVDNGLPVVRAPCQLAPGARIGHSDGKHRLSPLLAA